MNILTRIVPSLYYESNSMLYDHLGQFTSRLIQDQILTTCQLKCNSIRAENEITDKVILAQERMRRVGLHQIKLNAILKRNMRYIRHEGR
jgi:hypothetical protein